MPPDAVLAQAIDTGSLTQLSGHALVKLLHQEHTKGTEGLQAHDGQMGVVQVPRAHHHELRHHVGLPRHGNGGNVAEEEHILALELHLGKGVGRKGGGEQLQQGDHHGDLDRVLHKGEQRDLRPDVHIVLPARIFGDPLDGEAEYVLIQLKGGGQHPQKGQQHTGCDDDEEEIDQELGDEVAALLGSVVFNNSGCHSFFLLSQLSPLEPRNWMMVTISTSTNNTMAIALA